MEVSSRRKTVSILSLPKMILIEQLLLPFIGSVREYLALANTCTTMFENLAEKQTLKYIVKRMLLRNLNRILSSFYLNNEGLQSFLFAIPGSILSGSSVLQAYLGEKWHLSDLDIYIPRDANKDLSDATINHVISTLQNSFLPVDHDDSADDVNASQQDFRVDTIYGPYIHEDIDGCLSQVNLRNGRKIQLIFVKVTAEEPSVSYVLKAFDLTNVQNSYDGRTFHARYIDHVLNRTMELASPRSAGVATDGTSNALPPWYPTTILGVKNLERIEKYENRGFQFHIPDNLQPPVYIVPHIWFQLQKMFEKDSRIRQLLQILPLHTKEVLLLHDKEIMSIKNNHALKINKLIRSQENLRFTLKTFKRHHNRQKETFEKKMNKKKRKINELRSIIRTQRQQIQQKLNDESDHV